MAVPTAAEQLMLELINASRLDPLGEASRFITSYSPLKSSDPDIQAAFDYFGVSGSALLSAFQALSPAQPLAWNDALGTAADAHSQTMIQYDTQAHQVIVNGTAVEPPPQDRLTNAGYVWSSMAENIYAYAETELYAHAGFMVDWGSGPGGMQSPPGHRTNIMNPLYREVGIGEIPDPLPGVGPLVITEDFATRQQGPAVLVLGIALMDKDADDFYDIGEGRSDLTVAASGGGSVTSTASGGYTVGLAAGAQTLTFTGGGLTAPLTVAGSFASGTNVKLDIVSGAELHSSGSVSVEGPVVKVQALGVIGLALTAGAGNQEVTGTIGADTLTGGAGNDTVWGSGGLDRLDGGTGFDLASAEGATGIAYVDFALDPSKFFDGTGFADTISGFEGAVGGSGNDFLNGDGIANALFGADGNDALLGRAGADSLDGGGGADYVMGGVGYDAAETGTGDDSLGGGDGRDVIYGQDGNDVVDGAGGQDFVLAGTGSDSVSGAAGDDFIFAGSSYAFDQPNGGGGDTLAGGDGLDDIIGGQGADRIAGDSGNDLLYGGSDNDSLGGGTGDDFGFGEAGNDTVAGGTGFDYLYGGAGGDRFIFMKGDSYDSIFDFSAAEGDKLQLGGFGLSLAQLKAIAQDASFGGVAATVIDLFAATGSLDKLTVFGIAPAQLFAPGSGLVLGEAGTPLASAAAVAPAAEPAGADTAAPVAPPTPVSVGLGAGPIAPPPAIALDLTDGIPAQFRAPPAVFVFDPEAVAAPIPPELLTGELPVPPPLTVIAPPPAYAVAAVAAPEPFMAAAPEPALFDGLFA